MKSTTAFVAGVLAAATCANAFVIPGAAAVVRQQTRSSASTTVVFGGGKYDGKMWDDDAKADVAASYDPSQPRSETNFDPNEKDAAGNKCDPSGYYPGEGRYKDPIRPAVSYAEYQAKKAAEDAAGK